MRLKFTITAIIALFFLSANSQKTIKRCYSSEMNERALQMQPELRQVIDQLDAFSRTYEASENDRSVNKIIPVVFHIIHNYGPENISKEQVLSAMDVLNKDFQLLNEDQTIVDSDFQNLIANVGLEFRLAKIDPQGNCTEGITRTVSELTFFANDNVKQLISWPTNKYLNVWIVENISFSAGGYAYRPGNAPDPEIVNDGIVVINSQFGTLGTASLGSLSTRTLTHEVGHFFNLRHTWGSTNTPGLAANCNDDDGVTDTPNCIGINNSSCNTSANSCGTPLGDNVENYMDYSDCPRMFTTGQNNRMQASLNSIQTTRRNLWSSANLNATGVLLANNVCSPIVDFYTKYSLYCVNSPIQFFDLTYNVVLDNSWSWSWSFEGGTPATSSDQNPEVTYSQPGIYDVTLVISNGTSNFTITKESYFKVNTTTPILASPIVESFENTNFPTNGIDLNANWQYKTLTPNIFSRTTAARVSGISSLKYSEGILDSGVVSSIISPPISFVNASSQARIYFKVAYAQRDEFSNTKLSVFTSIDCGKTWSTRFSRSGDNLSTTNSYVENDFVPNDSEWEMISININPLVGKSSGLIRFSITEGLGNNLYIEDINIGPPLSIEDTDIDEEKTNIYPNPGNGDATLSYQLFQPKDISISIHDITGRLLGLKKISTKNIEGKIQLSDIVNSILMNGTYIVSLQTNNSSFRRLWVNE